ncbi:MAG TPA: response regulator [Chloroflexota bacterium]|nr:response regulator [Chloroflexota bacterium]
MSRHILIVEDDDVLVDSISRNLNARGYSTVTAATVDVAEIAIRECRPSLLLLDVDLPDGSGWDVLRDLRSQGDTDVPVIVISGLRPNPRLVTELNCKGVLEKPFPVEALLRLVRECLDEANGGNQQTRTETSSGADETHA